MKELLFRGFDINGNPSFTGYTIPSICASFTKDEMLLQRTFEWTGVMDCFGINIYRGDIVVKTNSIIGKSFKGVVYYEPQGCIYIIKNDKRYINLSDSRMFSDEEGIKLTDINIVGNSIVGIPIQ